MIKYFTALVLSFSIVALNAQKSVFLNISPVFNSNPLQMGVEVQHNSGEVYALDHFDYYVSDITLTHDGGQLTTVEQAVYIVEPDNHVLNLGNLALENIEDIEFTVGVPARFNTQQGTEAMDISLYPETHPLSYQSPSMYWGWSFGYMHMIIGGGEGSNYFELHSVGPTLQRQVNLSVVQTDVSESQIDLYIQCNVDEWLNGLELSTTGVIHGATVLNELIMDNVITEDVFTLSPSATSMILNHSAPNFYTWENQIIYSNLTTETSTITLFDQMGRQILHADISSSNGSIHLAENHPGLLFVFCKDAFGSVLEKQTIFIP